MIPTEKSGLLLDVVEEFFDSYVEELQNIGATGITKQAHDCATGAVQQQANLKNQVADANQYQDYMQTMEFNLGLGHSQAPAFPGFGHGHSHSHGHGHGHSHGGKAVAPGPDLMSLPSIDMDMVAAISSELAAEASTDTYASTTAPITPGVLSGAAIFGSNTVEPAFAAPMASAFSMQQEMPSLPQQQVTPEVSAHSTLGASEAEGTQETSGKTGTKPKRRRIRTEVQQEQNKAAQQRYRQRKKLKAQSLESTVDDLNKQVQELKDVAQKNQELQESKTVLETELLEKEAQIKRLNAELEETRQNQNSSMMDGTCTSEHTNDQEQSSAEDIKKLWHAKMEELQNVFEANNLRSAKVNGEGIPEEIVGTIAMLVEEVVALVGKVVRIDGLSMFDLVTANVDRCDHMCDEQTREVWTRVARLVSLSEDQVSKVKVLRSDHLKKLEDIYNSRQKLNLDAISMLLPSNNSVGKVGKTFGRMFSRNKSNGKMAQVLDSLKENLKEEQRLAQELEHVVLNRLLHPLQGAWYMLEAYPCYCDSLALLNGAYQVYVEDTLEKK